MHKEFKSTKFILYADSVYGMDHWGIGLGSEPFEIQGEKKNLYFFSKLG